jgi:hypothetical protein
MTWSGVCRIIRAGQAGVCLIVIAGCVAPQASTSVRPTGASGGASPGALTQVFRSERYGYEVRYPEGWEEHPATFDWSIGRPNPWNSGINDELRGPDARFSGSSQPLADGQSSEAWLRAYGIPLDAQPITIDGHEATLVADGAPALGGTVATGGVMFDAVVVVDGRAYNFNMDGLVDRAQFDEILGTVRLHPDMTGT